MQPEEPVTDDPRILLSQEENNDAQNAPKYPSQNKPRSIAVCGSRSGYQIMLSGAWLEAYGFKCKFLSKVTRLF